MYIIGLIILKNELQQSDTLSKKVNMTQARRMPANCPSCEVALNVSVLSCDVCHTSVHGTFGLPGVLRLSAEEQRLVLSFFIRSGNIKELAASEQVSYPTMRNRLDDLIEKLKGLYPEL